MTVFVSMYEEPLVLFSGRRMMILISIVVPHKFILSCRFSVNDLKVS